jgi:DNA-binding response OmpR family regulator
VAAPKMILVLDDDPSVRRMLQVLLEQDGHTVVVAADVRSALAQCAVQLPDLMVVDLMLPIEDGEMFLREFRRRWRHGKVPVILLSASTARNDIARRLAVEATLAKPFFAEDLRELVTSLTRDRETVVAS